jgi:hypothetical protein
MMKKYVGLLLLLNATQVQPVCANPDEYVVMPLVTYGERELDFKYGTGKKPDQDRQSAGSIGYGMGVTQQWMTELYVKYKRDGEPTKFDAIEWENKFQLIESGQYAVDVGFLTEIERPQDRNEGYEITLGPLFQTEFDKLQFNANFLFQHNFRTPELNSVRLNYQWQAKYRWLPEIEFGTQGFGDLKQWHAGTPGAGKEHRLGPALFGKYSLGQRQAIKYNMAWLLDVGEGKRGSSFRAQIEYEF